MKCQGSGRYWLMHPLVIGAISSGLLGNGMILEARAADVRDAQTSLSNTLPMLTANLEVPAPQDVLPGQPLFTPIPDLVPGQPDDIDLEIPTVDDRLTEPLPADTFFIQRFEFLGNTRFSDADFEPLVAPYVGRSLDLVDLTQISQIITRFYVDQGYITTGAVIRSEALPQGIAIVQIVEGRVDDIVVTGTERLRPGYVRSRLARGTQAPLNQARLLDVLQQLQGDPLVESFDARLMPSTAGANTLAIDVTEASSFSLELIATNDRSPSVGSFRRGAVLTERNLLGLGDRLSLGYSNTDGSDVIDVGYALPINAQGGEVAVRFGTTSNRIIEAPFNELDIQSSSQSYDVTLRQPLWQTARQEFAVGLGLSHYRSRSLLENQGIALSPGSDRTGRLRLSAVRLSQDWVSRSPRDVLALRSQFNLGIDLFNATRNEAEPDSQFFSWQGQAQWVRRLGPDFLLYLRGSAQLGDQPLVPVEQFSLGGINTVRGYRQDAVIGDNGLLASAELRIPVLRVPEWRGVMQLCPFIEAGRVWNRGDRPVDPSSLAAIGLGLQWQQPTMTLRLDWATPLTNRSTGRTWQENGVLFSITTRPF
jgi:hemolysin activation/secretion protein